MGLLIVTIAGKCQKPVSGHRKGKLTLSEPGCTSKTVDVNVCEGDCSSASYPVYETGEVKTGIICYGCEPRSFKSKKVKLDCGSKKQNVEYFEPDDCLCKQYSCEIGLRKKRSTNETADEDERKVESKTGLLLN
jgi:hypothetical protein